MQGGSSATISVPMPRDGQETTIKISSGMAGSGPVARPSVRHHTENIAVPPAPAAGFRYDSEGQIVVPLDSMRSPKNIAVSIGGEMRGVSTQWNNHSHILSDLESQTYEYYYYDSFSQSFHLFGEYATYPIRPMASASTGATGISFQSDLALSGKYQPSLCKDGHTHGFADLHTLRNAIHELGDAYGHSVTRYKHYQAALQEYQYISSTYQEVIPSHVHIHPPPTLPEYVQEFLTIVPDPFVICPNAHLRALIHSRNAPIHIDAEDIVVECDRCVINAPGTHFSFGPNAKNVVLRGISLMGATDTSMIFRHDGADVTFDECYWINNDGVGMQGNVLDLNSTSTANFHNCEISDAHHYSSPRMSNGGTTPIHSLTMRSKD